MKQIVLAFASLILTTGSVRAIQGTTWRVSLTPDGAQGNSVSSEPTTSSDGRYVAFSSYATNLAPLTYNGPQNVYRNDRFTGRVVLISSSPLFGSGNSESRSPSISGDGRFVAFDTAARLDPQDFNGNSDVYVRDAEGTQISRVSLPASGTGDPNGASIRPSLSSDGRLIAYESIAGNIVTNDSNGVSDIFVYDMQSNTTTRISISTNGTQANGMSLNATISADGRYVAFESAATNLISGDTNGVNDIFVRDMLLSTTIRVSVDSSGIQGNFASHRPRLSGTGQFVVFSSDATNLVFLDSNGWEDVFVHDQVSGNTARASVDSSDFDGNGPSIDGSISDDGRFVAFTSYASNLVVGDTNSAGDVFLRDRVAGTTQRISLSSAGVQGNNVSMASMVAPNGSITVFSSLANNLVGGDSNNVEDVFVRDLTPASTPYCTAKVNSLGCTPSLRSEGTPSASTGSGFILSAAYILNNTNGLMFYGTSGAASLPFQAGTLCVQAPLRRTPIQNAAGNAPPTHDCSGGFLFDFNAWIQTGTDPGLIPGQSVWAQFWSRDVGFAPPNNTNLTDGLTFTVGP
jgi:Tol biopolymer transport system component